jgi:alcohol dehydrogenase class IV
LRFEFATAQRILFGQGTINELPSIALGYGCRAMVVTGKDRIRRAGILADLEAKGLTCIIFGVPGEPTVDLVREGAAMYRSSACQLVISVGGGSAIDAGKAIAALAANPGDVLDYLEIVGKGSPLPNAPVPFIAVPTTAGTGSEVTRNAVLGSPEHRVKASLRSPLMLPRVALVDPDLTSGLPLAVSAATGLDALTQLIEPYVSCKSNPITDALCLDGLRHAARSLPQLGEPASRVGMSYASLIGGLALANAGLGAVHGFAAPIGGMFTSPHGAVCAAILPYAMRTNLEALRQRAPENQAVDRYREIAAILTGDPSATAEEGIDWVHALVRKLKIPGLSAWGIEPADAEAIVEKAAKASSMKANPIPLTTSELNQILSSAA